MADLEETVPGNKKALASTTSVRPPERPCIVVLAGDRPGRTYRIGERCMLGRAPEATVRFPFEDVSRLHARIEAERGGTYRIDDLDSRNGIRVNGVPASTARLRYGDRITIGSSVLLLFTQQDGLEEQLLRSQKLESLGRLAGGVAHDFNNLLGTVLTNISFLRGLEAQRTLGDPDVTETLEDCEAALKRAAELTSQLLGFARQGKYRDRPANISKLAFDVARLVRRTVGDEIDIQLDVTPDLIVLGDGTQLQQVLMNLYMNACDAMPSGGTLRVVVRQSHGYASTLATNKPHVAIDVQDDGIGMDDDTRNRAFEPFFTTKDVGKGTGLGLAMVYGIVKNHGGEVSIDSVVDQGTTVSVVLPLGDPDSIPDSGSTGGSEQPLLGGRVLLVDDDDLFRSSTKRLLEHVGYTVHDVRGGAEAVDFCETRGSEVDVVLLDLQMPSMNGEETLARLLAADPNRRIVLLTAYADDARARAAIAAGAKGFVQKPFDLGTLQAAIIGAAD